MTKATRVHSTPPTNTSKTGDTQSATKPPESPREAFDQACGMEKPWRVSETLRGALCRIAQTLNDGNGADIVYELALTIQARMQKLDNTHEYFFRLHHPDRERFEHEGWPSSEPE
jgi:hypothetical protein